MSIMIRILHVVSCAVMVFAVGCFRSPNSHFYALTSQHREQIDSLSKSGVSVAVSSVGFPQYLDDPRMIVRANENSVDRLEYDRWAEDLQVNFMRVFVADLAGNVQSSNVFATSVYDLRPAKYQVQLEVLQFDVTNEGRAVLKVRWTLADSVDALKSAPMQVSEFSLLSEDSNHSASVAALSQLIENCARVVAAAIPAARS